MTFIDMFNLRSLDLIQAFDSVQTALIEYKLASLSEVSMGCTSYRDLNLLRRGYV